MRIFRRLGNPDPDAFLAELSRAHPGKQSYSSMDRYRDFRALFLGTEQGKRVLYELLGWGGVFRSSAPRAKFDPHQTMFHDGQRDLALRIMATMNAEPADRPSKATNKE